MSTVLTKRDVVKVVLPAELEYINIKLLSDWHIGDRFCDFKAIEKQVAGVAEDPNCYAICCGDLMNNATKASVSDIYSEKLSPQEQIDKVLKILTPIRDRILYITSGNHEARTYREAGIDTTAVIAVKLDLQDRYSKNGGIMSLSLGRDRAHVSPNSKQKLKYFFYILHGNGNGSKAGGKVNRLVDLASIVDADIYIHAHTHLPVVTMVPFCRIDRAHDLVTMEDRLFVNASAKLEYGGYGKEKAFVPASMADPVIFINGKKKEIGCSIRNYSKEF